jgi:hypothetical protein
MSAISDYFYFTKETIIKCNNCQTARFKFQTFFYLDFQLNEVLKFKKSLFKNNKKTQIINIENNLENGNLMTDQNRCNTYNTEEENNDIINNVNILDCFFYDRYIKSQMMYCNLCKGSYQFFYNSKISFTPEIMIIFISRLEKINLEMKFEFYEYLNVQQYVDLHGYGFNYQLIGVIVSLDKPGKEKHFIAFCRSPIDRNWYKYDDINVTLVSNVNEEIFKSNPSILFYQNFNNNKI